jgi:coenzyme F420 hydrogenase subunit beta
MSNRTADSPTHNPLSAPPHPPAPVPPVLRPPVGPAAARELCTDCGISRTADAKRCGRACQFIQPDYARLEAQVHGRARDAARPDELHFGPLRRMLRAALAEPRPGAQ